MRNERFAVITAVLGIAFLVRVLGQVIQRWAPVDFLPDYERWQGSGLWYPALLGLQIAILVLFVVVVIRMNRGLKLLGPRWIKPVFVLGVLYFAVMGIRLLIGVLADVNVLGDDSFTSHKWFSTPIPPIFHLVLATGMMLISTFQRRWSEEPTSIDEGWIEPPKRVGLAPAQRFRAEQSVLDVLDEDRG